jgi:hypothetical protein
MDSLITISFNATIITLNVISFVTITIATDMYRINFYTFNKFDLFHENNEKINHFVLCFLI